MHQKSVSFVTIGFLKIMDLNLNSMFVIDDLLTMAHYLKHVAILGVIGVNFRCLLIGINQNEALKKLNHSAIYARGVL